MLLDFNGPRVSRFGKSEVNAAASVLDDTQSDGIENSPQNGQADEEEQDTACQFTQHVKDYFVFSGSGTRMTMRGIKSEMPGVRGAAL